MVLWFNKKISDQLENMKKFSFISSSKKIYATTISRALIVINGKRYGRYTSKLYHAKFAFATPPTYTTSQIYPLNNRHWTWT